MKLQPWLLALMDEECGNDLTEYGMIAGLIALALVAILQHVSGSVGAVFSSAGSVMTSST